MELDTALALLEENSIKGFTITVGRSTTMITAGTEKKFHVHMEWQGSSRAVAFQTDDLDSTINRVEWRMAVDAVRAARRGALRRVCHGMPITINTVA
jgi:hypothetical protein